MTTLLKLRLPKPSAGARPRAILGLSAAVLLAAGTLAAGTLVAGTLVAEAEAPPLPAGSPGRFTMQPADGGILRLDTQTGSLSMCRKSADSWTCAMLPDDRNALTDEVHRLKTENEELKSSVKRLEELAGVPGATPPSPHAGVQLPSEEDVDKAMSYVERMLKKFKDKLKELEDSDGHRGQPL